ncbi:MAG: hypothetical protein GWN86_07085 [Desulfobacterales bacterium]|nr:hypothetical protein [Desulfobacterales bacterium]
MLTYKQFQLGSVSSGTLRPENLLPVFANTLESFDSSDDLIQEARKVWEDLGNDKSKADYMASDVINDLIDAIQAYCPPFVYFGAHPGDGADFGFWPDWDNLETISTSDSPLHLEEDNIWVHINDHGSITVLTNDNGKPGKIIWRSE